MSTPPKVKRGFAKPISTVIAGFFVMIGLISACGPEVTEVEVQGPETTVTVTKTAPTVTKTTTVTSEPEEIEEVELVVDPEPEPVEPLVDDTMVQGLSLIHI